MAANAYRPWLARGPVGVPRVGWVLLNPSEADVDREDPTSRRLMGFTRDLGYAGYFLANAYSGRATQPRDLWKMADPIGPGNDAYLAAAAMCPITIVAWGANIQPARAREVETLLRNYSSQLWCLGRNGDGTPKHPLYLPYSQKLTLYE